MEEKLVASQARAEQRAVVGLGAMQSWGCGAEQQWDRGFEQECSTV